MSSISSSALPGLAVLAGAVAGPSPRLVATSELFDGQRLVERERETRLAAGSQLASSAGEVLSRVLGLDPGVLPLRLGIDLSSRTVRDERLGHVVYRGRVMLTDAPWLDLRVDVLVAEYFEFFDLRAPQRLVFDVRLSYTPPRRRVDRFFGADAPLVSIRSAEQLLGLVAGPAPRSTGR